MMAMEESTSSSAWTWEQEKAFENAIAEFAEDDEKRWEHIAAAVPGKTIDDIKEHYQLLVEDIESIETGRVTLPNYVSMDANEVGSSKKSDSHHGGKGSRSDQERRKGVAWTEEEHRQFLLGLDKYGKGDWRSISRNFVVTRTPTQVASHAQKYFIRLNSMNKDRRRSSIHDITSVGNGDASAPQSPITGQSGVATNGSKASKNPAHTTITTAGVGMYGTAIGKPAVGTPVLSPSSHMVYPIPGAMVPGAPMNHPTMAYPMPPNTAAQR